MNREIKFKYIFQHDDTGRIVTKVFGIEDVENALNNDDYRLYGVVARCQLTGLKDKNGKEIYEGDIRCGKYYFETEEQTRFQVIKWDEKNACFYWDGPEIPRFIDVEVIGNIYENPELLK